MDILKAGNKILHYVNRVIKNSNFFSISGVIAYAAFEALVIFLLARSFTQEVFGEWVLFYSGFFFFDRINFGFYGVSLLWFLSGAKNITQEKEIIGSGLIAAILISSFFSILIYSAYFIYFQNNASTGFLLFCIWYPIISYIRIPFNNSLALLQVKGDFRNIFILRVTGMGTFVVFLVLNLFFFKLNVNLVVLAFVVSNIIGSLTSLLKRWSGLRNILYAKMKTIRQMAGYGKYSMGTSLGSNMLRDADVFLIGLLMSSKDVAMYAIPQRLIDILNIPLAAAVAVALPGMSRANQNDMNTRVRYLFYKNTGTITILFFPLIASMMLLADKMVWILGGGEYLKTAEAVNILRIFLIYGLFLTLDRFIGVTLDSINLPDKNFKKVMIMVLINVIGDVVAIVFFKSLLGVALVTVINVILGVFIGAFILKKEINVKTGIILSAGYKNIWRSFSKYAS